MIFWKHKVITDCEASKYHMEHGENTFQDSMRTPSSMQCKVRTSKQSFQKEASAVRVSDMLFLVAKPPTYWPKPPTYCQCPNLLQTPLSQILAELFSAGYAVSSLSEGVSDGNDGINQCIKALARSARLTPNGKQVCSL